MTANDEALTSGLAMLGGGLADAELDQRVTRFQDRLRRLRDDPAEATRIDALVMDAGHGEHDLETATRDGLTIHVNGGNVYVSHGEPGEEAGGREYAETRLGAEDRKLLLQRIKDLESARDGTSARTRPRRVWETVPRPAFGGGVFIAILAAATVTTALHATTTAMIVIASVLTVTTAIAALVSVLMPWTAFWALTRRGGAYEAMGLLARGTRMEYAEPRDAAGFEAARQAPSSGRAGILDETADDLEPQCGFELRILASDVIDGRQKRVIIEAHRQTEPDHSWCRFLEESRKRA